MGRPVEAVPYFERCVAIMRAHEGEQEYEGTALFNLAKALHEAGADEQRTLSLAREARASFEIKPPPTPEDRDRLEKLLAELEPNRTQ